MPSISTIVIGNDTLTLNSAKHLIAAGHRIELVVSRLPDMVDWAASAGIRHEMPGAGLAERLGDVSADWLLSIANLDIIPAEVLNKATRGAVNFHDGPLPRYAGLNAPVWALIAGEPRHAITWHLIEGGVDEGRILLQSEFETAPGETALTLNTKCFAAAMESFPKLVDMLARGNVEFRDQDLTARSYFGLIDRPACGATIDFRKESSEICNLIKALDHGGYWNPLAIAKLETDSDLFLVGQAEPADGAGAAGTILSRTDDSIIVASGDGAVMLSKITTVDGNAAALNDLPEHVPAIDQNYANQVTKALRGAAKNDAFWRGKLESYFAGEFSFSGTTLDAELCADINVPTGMTADDVKGRFAILAARMNGEEAIDIAFGLHSDAPKYTSAFVPVRVDLSGTVNDVTDGFIGALHQAESKGPFAVDLLARMGGETSLPAPIFGINTSDLAAVTLSDDAAQLIGDPARISAEEFAFMVKRLDTILAAGKTAEAKDLPVLSEAEAHLMLTQWQATDVPYDTSASIPSLFAAQREKSPDADALIFEGQALSYADLHARVCQTAHVLAELGVAPGDLVGLHLKRSAELVIGALAIMQLGAGYVPLDPDYPADRVALYIEDSGTKIIVTSDDLAPHMPANQASVLKMSDPRISNAPTHEPEPKATSKDLAYLIYTSGSTGRPKGVMIEHRNVVNFFAGMDARIPHQPGDHWLAVTSLSFDISVLELFWTLTRGLTVVISGDENRALVSNGHINQTGRGMEFSLYYWGNDDGVGRDKYTMLLEGAKFADQNGFCAVWTPERHFHAFGGPYPNPSVTGAAVAAVTQNIGVRAGSCVAPLHHPARIAEEWAVIDNLTNGRAGMAIASGWQPHDFLLRPENTPPENKPAMYDAIDKVRALWRGEEVEFPLADGSTHAALTQPRPVSKELPLWVTTAGNPATWREAGEIGANVLTHLLGQSIEEVGEKIKIYHDALRGAGHDPENHRVTLMLHSFVAETRDEAEAIAREPMKDYLRSAAGLIKQFAWAFPAFKKPQGVDTPMQLDLGMLSEDELDAILEFAFLRYFEESGLFGTVDDCLSRVEDLKRIGVDEIACLVDFGIERQLVLDGLRPLAEVLRQSNLGTELAEDDFSIAAQIIRHNVSHLQCTPSMARMLVGNDEAKAALSQVKYLMIGGEALPGSLVSELQGATKAHIENMYGPTETTIWSTTSTVKGGEDIAGIGTPIANTQAYILDETLQPAPIGVAGDLYLGGDGVARGYWQREDLTAERFVDDPFRDGNRMYHTGDLARWQPDGTLDFLGRADGQIKLRGYRIELGEIEAAMEGFSGLRQSVVVAHEASPGHMQLVGYYLAETAIDEQALAARLAAELPAHMVPARFMKVDEFPLTPNKKIDRKALPEPVSRPQLSAVTSPIKQGTAAKIAEIWSRILGVASVGPQDHFFHLGGHSLLAVQAHREMREALGANKLSITDVFRFPTLSGLAARVDELSGPVVTSPEPSVLPAANNARAQSRTDAMSRRREMRAARMKRGA